MLVCDPLRDRQAKTGSFLLVVRITRAVESVEDSGKIRRADTDSCVRHDDCRMTAIGGDCNVDDTAGPRVLDGVVEKNAHKLSNEAPVAGDGSFVELRHLESDVLRCGQRA